MEEPARGSRKRSQLQAHAGLPTNVLQRHWEWQEDRRTDLEPGFVASLDVKTSFDGTKPSVVSRGLSLTRVHGHVVAAPLAEIKDVRGSACFENYWAQGAARTLCKGMGMATSVARRVFP